jgi:4-hydroxy-tetrahydrodipicolinate reductase
VTPLCDCIVVGLGSIGTAVARALGSHAVAAVEIAAGHPSFDGPVTRTIAEARAAAPGARVAVLTTSSKLVEIVSQIEEAVAQDLHVVSTCEELAWPALRRPDLGERIDRAASARGRAVIGVGVNPGFVMDWLPLAAARACVGIERIEVERVVDTTRRRGPLRKKVGEGLPEAQWRARAKTGDLGHVGLAESAALLCAGLGWTPGSIEETLDPVVRDGVAQGLVQTATAAKGRVTLRLEMSADAPGPRDHVRISGDPPIELMLPDGIHGDRGTIGTVLSAVRRVGSLSPGLRTVLDL